MELNGIAGGFYKISVWLSRFSGVNLLWLLFNLPMVLVASRLVFVENINQLIVGGIITAIIAPFVFFPATTAMFAVVRQWILGKDISTISSFWGYYKENYVRSMQGGIIIAILWLILAVDYYYFLLIASQRILFYFFFILTFVLVVFTLHFCSITVHAHTKLTQALKSAMLLTFGSPLATLKIGLASSLILYISFQVFTFLIPFFMGSLTAYISLASFLGAFAKIRPGD